LDVEHRRQAPPRLVAQLQDAVDVGLPAAPRLQLALRLRDERLDGRPCERPTAACIEVRVAREHRELRAGLVERHPTRASTGAWSESRRPPTRRRSSDQTEAGVTGRPRTRIWSMLSTGAEKPQVASSE